LWKSPQCDGFMESDLFSRVVNRENTLCVSSGTHENGGELTGLPRWEQIALRNKRPLTV
jgi:hypothetical protein